MDIDFDVIFKYVKDAIKSDKVELIEEDFIDNIEGYLWNIYGLTDFIEEDNEYVVELIIEKWEEYIKNKYLNKQLEEHTK
jgi:hypothetical protein